MVFRFSDSIFIIFQRYSTALYRFFGIESIHLRNSFIHSTYFHNLLKIKRYSTWAFQSFQHFIQIKWKTLKKTEESEVEFFKKSLNC